MKYVGSLFPITSLFRIRKFIDRGWTINAGEIFKISWDVSKLDLNKPIIMQEQLTGCDVAYFNQVIRVLKKEYFDKKLPIERTYLFELIARTFDKDNGDEE